MVSGGGQERLLGARKVLSRLIWAVCLFLFGCWLKVPVGVREEFLARVGVLNRVKVPVLVRWRNRLEPGEILTVTVRAGFASHTFYAKYRKDFRITVPKLVSEDPELEAGDVVKVTLHPVRI